MMGKAARRKREPAAQGGDIRARIANEAAQVRNAARAGIQDAKETPALSALLDSARKALEQSIQKSFEHEGGTYWLRVAIPMARIIIFDTPTTLEPMAFALSGSCDEFGHEPGEPAPNRGGP